MKSIRKPYDSNTSISRDLFYCMMGIKSKAAEAKVGYLLIIIFNSPMELNVTCVAEVEPAPHVSGALRRMSTRRHAQP